jgi:heterogeneous nuclear ribonucleoprotein F/H
MARFPFPISAALALTIFLWGLHPAAQGGHGGGHGGGGHGGGGFGGHGGFGYGGYHGFGYGHGFRGFGFGGFGYPGFGFYGFPGFGFGGLGFSGFGLGGLGFGGLGNGGWGLGGLGYGGLGFGGYGFGGYGGYGGFSPACNCCCLSAYAYPAGNAPGNGGYAPANGGDTPLPMPNAVGLRSRYVDYYARKANQAVPSTAFAGASSSRYVDYYTRNVGPAEGDKARLHVALPADAELWLNGQRMQRKGAERDYITPPLQTGLTYAYQVRARWTQDGQPVEEAIEVKVRANKTTIVSLGTASLAKR